MASVIKESGRNRNCCCCLEPESEFCDEDECWNVDVYCWKCGQSGLTSYPRNWNWNETSSSFREIKMDTTACALKTGKSTDDEMIERRSENCDYDCACERRTCQQSRNPVEEMCKRLSKSRWKLNYTLMRNNFNCFVILFLTFIFLLNHPGTVDGFPFTHAHPTTSQSHSQSSECDWTGRGTTATTTNTVSASLVQTVILRCTRGRIHWEHPKGGLKVTISPSIGSLPYKLCLENSGSKRRHRVLLEETDDTGSDGQLQRRLLSVLTRTNSNCYRIQDPSAVLYIESHGDTTTETESSENRYWNSNELGLSESDPAEIDNLSHAISIAYEVEALRGDGDPCRPCSESEVLQTFCSADVVARGSILHVQPGNKYDSIYVKSNLVLHQNHPVFTSFVNLPKFLQTKSTRFDVDKPQRVLASKSNSGQNYYGGIVSHPSICSSSVGPGDFLWLIKFRFGRPLVDCVIYWDKWVDIARTKEGECPLRIN